MAKADLIAQLEVTRKKTLDLLDGIAKLPQAREALAFRPGPGRATIAWQIMHVAATDDRHVHVRMVLGEPQFPELVKRFAVGSIPDDNVPTIEEIRQYLASQRQEILEHMAKVAEDDLDTKPHPQALWTYREWMQVLAWHEAHHHGQAHLSFNLWRTQHAPEVGKMGH